MDAERPKPRVLVVDDEDANLETFHRVFRLDYDISLASSAAEALALLHRREFDVALVDYAMPNESGVVFLRHAILLQPGMGRLMVTAHGDLEVVKQAQSEGLCEAIIMKPWDRETVARWVNNTVRMASLRKSVSAMKGAVKSS